MPLHSDLKTEFLKYTYTNSTKLFQQGFTRHNFTWYTAMKLTFCKKAPKRQALELLWKGQFQLLLTLFYSHNLENKPKFSWYPDKHINRFRTGTSIHTKDLTLKFTIPTRSNSFPEDSYYDTKIYGSRNHNDTPPHTI